jgi:hypothetical protein
VTAYYIMHMLLDTCLYAAALDRLATKLHAGIATANIALCCVIQQPLQRQ